MQRDNLRKVRKKIVVDGEEVECLVTICPPAACRGSNWQSEFKMVPTLRGPMASATMIEETSDDE